MVPEVDSSPFVDWNMPNLNGLSVDVHVSCARFPPLSISTDLPPSPTDYPPFALMIKGINLPYLFLTISYFSGFAQSHLFLSILFTLRIDRIGV